MIYLSLSNSCNYKCPCCPCSDHNIESSVTYEAVADKISKEAAGPRPPAVTLSGGEPTIHPDFLAIMKLLYENRIPVTILTNSSRLTDADFNQRLLKAYPATKNISIITTLYNVDPMQHHAETGVLIRFLAAIRRTPLTILKDHIDQDDSLYEEPLCLAVVKDGEIKAAVLFKKHENDELELSFAYADDDSKIRLPGLLAAAAESIDHDYSESDLWFCAVNAESHALADHLLEGDDQKLIVKETVCRAYWLGWSIKEVKDIYSIAGKTA